MKKKIKITGFSKLAKQLALPILVFLLLACVFNVMFLTMTNLLDYINESERDAYKMGSLSVSILEEYDSLPFLVPYWAEHGTEMEHVFEKEQIRIKDTELHHRWPGLGLIQDASPDTLEKMDPEIQKLYAEVAYSEMCTRFSTIKDSFKPKYLYTFIIVDNRFYYLVTGLKDDETHTGVGGDIYELGDTREYQENEYPALDHLLKTGEYEYRLDATVSKDEATAVHLFLPVHSRQGKMVAIVGVTNDFVSMVKDGLKQSEAQIIVNVFMFLILTVLMFTLLDYRVLLPLSKTNDAVNSYKEEKNSEKVLSNLKKIHSKNEIQELAASFGGLATELDLYIDEVKNVTAKNERIGAELNLATKIQASMLPNEFPDRKEFMLYASMDPAKEVGGDFYDFFFVDDDHLALVIADVSGKGVPAALFMTISMTLIKTRTMMGGDLSSIFADVNQRLCERNVNDFFVTVWMAIIDLKTGDGIAANAGHEHPCICRKDGKYELVVYHHSLSIGAMDGVLFKQHEFHLDPGDRIFVYTDGVPEATDAKKELFGTDRMLQALNESEAETPKEVIEKISESIDEFVGGEEQFDDTTMLSFFYKGAE